MGATSSGHAPRQISEYNFVEKMRYISTVVSFLSDYTKAELASRYLNNRLGICLIISILRMESDRERLPKKRFRTECAALSYAYSIRKVLDDVAEIERSTNEVEFNAELTMKYLLTEARGSLAKTSAAYDKHSVVSRDTTLEGIFARCAISWKRPKRGEVVNLTRVRSLTNEYNQVVFNLVETYIEGYRNNKAEIDEFLTRVVGEQELESLNLKNPQDVKIYEKLKTKHLGDLAKCSTEGAKYAKMRGYIVHLIEKAAKDSTGVSKKMSVLADKMREFREFRDERHQQFKELATWKILSNEYRWAGDEFREKLLFKGGLERLLKRLDEFEEILINSCHKPLDEIHELLFIRVTGRYFQLVVLEFASFDTMLLLPAPTAGCLF